MASKRRGDAGGRWMALPASLLLLGMAIVSLRPVGQTKEAKEGTWVSDIATEAKEELWKPYFSGTSPQLRLEPGGVGGVNPDFIHKKLGDEAVRETMMQFYPEANLSARAYPSSNNGSKALQPATLVVVNVTLPPIPPCQELIDATAQRRFVNKYKLVTCSDWPQPRLPIFCRDAPADLLQFNLSGVSVSTNQSIDNAGQDLVAPVRLSCAGGENKLVPDVRVGDLLYRDYPIVSVPVRWRGTELHWRSSQLKLRHFNGSESSKALNTSHFAVAMRVIGQSVPIRRNGGRLMLLVMSATQIPVPLSLFCLNDRPLANITESSDLAPVLRARWERPSLPCCVSISPTLAAKDWWPTITNLAAKCGDFGATPRFFIYGAPHFGGGAQQFSQALLEKGWQRAVFPDDADMALASCVKLIDRQVWSNLAAPGRLLSATPGERVVVLKRALLSAVRKKFESAGCSYTSLLPESFIVSVPAECKQFLSVARTVPSNTTWFLKSALESFGRGITVADTLQAIAAVKECGPGAPPPKFFVQRGVDRIVTVQGRKTQGRTYIFASNYDPLSVWFFDGYFNVAGVEGETKEALVTNLGSNQKSRRLLSREFYSAINLTDAQIRLVRQRVKEALLTVFLALPLTRRAASFSLFGVDILIDESLGVRVLEANCNCELFFDAKKFGQERVDISSALVRGMLDAVVVTNRAPEQFKALLTSVPADFAVGQAELLYSEAIEPPWSFVPLSKCFPSA